jgi:uncharacterized membrane protein YdjX (TVP38/TMEM64 family)
MPDAVPTAPRLPRALPPRVWFTLGSVDITTTRLVIAGIVLFLAIGLAISWRRIDLAEVHARAQELPGWTVAAAVTLLPLAGVPVAMLHIAAGVRFGFTQGLIVVTVATVIQHAVGYGLVKLAPKVFAKRFAHWRQRFPRGAHGPMTIFAATMPGLPYLVPIYLLPMIGVPLRTLLLIGAPLHIVRAIVSIVGGDLSDEVTPARIAGLIAYYISLTVVCAVTFRRMRTLLKPPKQT